MAEDASESDLKTVKLKRVLSQKSIATKSKVDQLREKFRNLTQQLSEETETSLAYFESYYEKFSTSLQAKKEEDKRQKWLEEMRTQMQTLTETLRQLENGPAIKEKKKIKEKEQKSVKKQSSLTKLLTRLVFGFVMIFSYVFHNFVFVIQIVHSKVPWRSECRTHVRVSLGCIPANPHISRACKCSIQSLQGSACSNVPDNSMVLVLHGNVLRV